MQHATNTSSRNNTTYGTIVAIALATETGKIQLNNDMKSITTGVTVPGNTYQAVTGLTTDAILLPVSGEILIIASVNSESSTGGGEMGYWKFQMSTDNVTWTDIGSEMSRSFNNNNDYGIASVGIMETSLPRDNYYFRLVHKGSEATPTIQTLNTNLVAVALGYDDPTLGGRNYPAFSTSGTGTATTSATLTPALSQDGTPANNTDMFFYAQYKMSATDAMDAPTFDMYCTDKNGSAYEYSSEDQQRRLYSSDDVGSGASVGLAENLLASTEYTASLRNAALGTAVELTTSSIVLLGFQTTDKPAEGYWIGGASGNETQWNNTANWADLTIPTSSTNVTLFDKTYDPVIGVAANCKNLDIVSGSVTISPDYSLTVAEEITNTVNGGLVIQSTADGDGSLIYTTGTPNATAERHIVQNEWHLVSPVTIPTTANTFYLGAANLSWLAEYDETIDEYDYITDENASLSRAKGYSYWIIDAQGAQTIDFTGTLIGGDVTTTLVKEANGWNLIGNPFSSALNWATVSADITTGTAYVWDNSVDGYLYSTSGTGGVPSPNVGTITDDIIPMGQGFLVQANSAGDFTIPANARVHNTADFIKSANADGNEPNQFIRIDLNGGYYGNTVFVGFPSFGTDDFDISGDATKLYSTTENIQFFAVENDNELCINANAPLTEGESKAVPLNLVQINNGSYTMEFSDLNQLKNADITLEDIKTGNTQNIRENSIYSFDALNIDNPERFLLHFAWAPNGIEEDFEQSSNIQIYSYGKEVYIRSTDDAVSQNGIVFIYDLMGHELAVQKIGGDKLVKIPVNIANNYVVVKVVKSSSTKIQKVLIK